MKKQLYLIIILLIANIIQAQTEKQNNPLANLLSLQKVSEPTEADYINIIYNELYSYGDGFKYHEELKKGEFEFELERDYLLLKILNPLSNNLNKAKEEYKDVIKYEKVRIYNEAKKKNDFAGFKMLQLNNYVDIYKAEMNMLNASQTASSGQFLQIGVKQKDHLFWDKNILNGVVPHGQTRVLNRERIRTFLRQPDGQIGNLFFDATDGTIIPDGDGQHAKLFITDKNWKRLVYCDKDFQPSGGGNLFKVYNNSNGASFEYPTSITFGNKIQTNIFQMYVADYESKKIKVIDYNSSNYLINNNPANISTLSKPYDIGFHYGSSLVYTNDDKIYYSTDHPAPAIKCISINGAEILTANNFRWRGSLYAMNPGRIDVFTGMHSYYYYKERSMLAYVDKALNAVVYFRLTTDGEFFTNPPEAMWIQQYPSTHSITSVKFLGNLPYASDPASVLVTGNQISNNEGALFLSKVKFRPENSGVYLIPFMVDYLASTKSLFTGEANGSLVTPNYKDIRNIESNTGFIDIFTSETWNNETGMRRLKPGIDVVNQSIGVYCKDYKTVAVSYKGTSPANIQIKAYTKAPLTAAVPTPIIKVNGSNIQVSNGRFRALIPSGDSYFNIQLNPANTFPAYDKIIIEATFVPQDESLDNVNNYKLSVPLETGIVQCASTNGGCPFISVLDSNEFLLDNNILHKSEFAENINSDITDKYLLNIPPQFNPADSLCTFKISELNDDYSYFDNFKLIAVDHPIGTKVGITESNHIVTYMPEYITSPLSALLNNEDVTGEVGYDSTGLASGNENDSMSVKFSKKKYRIQSAKHLLKTDNILADSVAVIIDPDRNPGSINPATKDYMGIMYGFDPESDYSSPPVIFSTRQSRSSTIIPLGKDVNIDSVFVDFNSSFSLTYFATITVYYGGYIENELPLVFAQHDKDGNVYPNLTTVNGVYSEMDPAHTITLQFKDTLAPLTEGWIRDYIIITKGRYSTAPGGNMERLSPNENNIPNKYSLAQNYPNPFNPVTTISYDLPVSGLVKLKVYDITGREIANLVNEFKEAGSYQIKFNGNGFASGVYFYKMEADNFTEIKRMVLIK